MPPGYDVEWTFVTGTSTNSATTKAHFCQKATGTVFS